MTRVSSCNFVTKLGVTRRPGHLNLVSQAQAVRDASRLVVGEQSKNYGFGERLGKSKKKGGPTCQTREMGSLCLSRVKMY